MTSPLGPVGEDRVDLPAILWRGKADLDELHCPNPWLVQWLMKVELAH